VEERLRPAIEHVMRTGPFLVLEGDPVADVVLAVTPNIESLLGYAPREVVGVPGWWAGHLHPQDLQPVARSLRAALRAREPRVVLEFRLRHREGTYRRWETTAEYVYDERGRAIAVRAHALDVTEHRRAQEERRAAQVRYRSLVENAIEGVFRTALDGTVLFVNPALARMAGFETPEEYRAAVPNVAAAYGDPAQRDEILRRLREHGEVTDVEIRGSRLVGEGRWATMNARLVRDEQGSPVAIEGTLVDVTARKRAEQALQESEERFRRLADATSEGVAIHDGERVIEINRAVAEMFGCEPEDLVGRSPLELVAPGSVETVVRQLRTRSEEPFEATCLRPDGSTFLARVEAKTIPWGEATARVVVVRDVTEQRRAEAALREAEARYRTLVEQLPAVTYVWASDREHPERSSWVYLSPQLETLLGYDPQEWIGGKDGWGEAIHEEDRDRVVAEDARTDQTLGRFSAEYRIRTKDGGWLWVHDVAEPFQERDGMQLWHGLMLDTTARKLAEEELRQSMQLLRRATEERRYLLSRLTEVQEDERRRLAADIHDDPIQKMTAAGLRAEALRRRLSDPEQIRALDRLEAAIGAAIGRLRRLLFELRPSSLDREGLAAALRQYVAELEDPDGPTVRIEDRMVLEPPSEVRIVAYRIAQEALTNVRKHAGPTSVEVLLESRGEDLCMRIRDRGGGFDLADIDDRRPGHLGLSTMRERAELAGGSLRIESVVGGGTTVEVRLPTRMARRTASSPSGDDRRSA
jgi:PAS domain S-box-containing protein